MLSRWNCRRCDANGHDRIRTMVRQLLSDRSPLLVFCMELLLSFLWLESFGCLLFLTIFCTCLFWSGSAGYIGSAWSKLLSISSRAVLAKLQLMCQCRTSENACWNLINRQRPCFGRSTMMSLHLRSTYDFWPLFNSISYRWPTQQLIILSSLFNQFNLTSYSFSFKINPNIWRQYCLFQVQTHVCEGLAKSSLFLASGINIFTWR